MTSSSSRLSDDEKNYFIIKDDLNFLRQPRQINSGKGWNKPEGYPGKVRNF